MKKDYVKKFSRAVAIRAIKTVCQTAVGGIGAAAVMGGVDWWYVASSAALAGIVSVLMSVGTGLPEVKLPDGEE